MRVKILVLPGDGIGPEITEATLAVLDRANARFKLGLEWRREELLPPEARQPDREGVTLTIDGEMERVPCALDRPDYQSIRVTLNSVRFSSLMASLRIFW